MRKFKKLWKALSGAVSWNLKESKTSDRLPKQLKRNQKKNVNEADANKKLA